MKFAKMAIGESLPLSFYESLHERDINVHSPSVQDEQNKDIISPSFLEGSSATNQTHFVPMAHRNETLDLFTKNDCLRALSKTFDVIKKKLDTNDQNYFKSVMKFADRSEKISTPRLASAFHTFGSQQSDSLRNTASSIVKRAKRSKIHVQPEAVKRRKVKSGSKNKICKGQQVRKNPFRLEAGQRMRLYHFAENVRRNETVAKKAGRSMATKTRCYETGKKRWDTETRDVDVFFIQV